MAQPKLKTTEPEPELEPVLSVAEVMINECGLEHAVALVMQQARNEIADMEQMGDIVTEDDEKAILGHIRTLQVIVNDLTKLRTEVVTHASSKVKEVRDHFRTTINAMKKTRLGLRAALLK